MRNCINLKRHRQWSYVEEFVSLDDHLCTDNKNEDVTPFISRTSAELYDELDENYEKEANGKDKCDGKNFNNALTDVPKLQNLFLNVGDT